MDSLKWMPLVELFELIEDSNTIARKEQAEAARAAK